MQKPTAPRSESQGVAEAISVLPCGDARAVPDGPAARPGKVSPMQAQVRARGDASQAPIADDRVGDRFTLGRQAFEKISAVEGIRLSRTMKRDLMEAKANAGSAEEARHILASKYGRRRP